MTVLHFGLTPKMKPVSPKRAATVAALDIGTSKIVCLIARLAPRPPQDVLRRRSHGVEIMGEPNYIEDGPAAGSTWVYFKAPWGLQLELVSYPRGKGYERKAKTLLWHPGHPTR